MTADAKIFDEAEQVRFAAFSGDRNPVHMDRIAARRTQMGLPVVHGLNGLLWALDRVATCERLAISKIEAHFKAPIFVGDRASVLVARRSERNLRVQILVDRQIATAINVTLGAPATAPPHRPDVATEAANWPEAPIDLPIAGVNRRAGAFAFAQPIADAGRLYPALSQAISPQRVSALAALSRLVGMVCPGLNSIFNRLSIGFTDEDSEPALFYRAQDVDERFRLVKIEVAGPGISGEVEAFVRPPPAAQADYGAIRTEVMAGAFSGEVALVVGGSRGLGEVTAKALAAGGARVLITYAVGRADAERVARDITAGGGDCAIRQFDARGDVAAQLASLEASPTQIYYCATPPIQQRRGGLLDPEVLADFMLFYVTAFYRLCQALAAPEKARPVSVFYPSSEAVTDTPPGWAEYAMAKAAGEVLCGEMNRHMTGITILLRRLPRLHTDQTLSMKAVPSAPAQRFILPIVSEITDLNRSA